MIRELLDQFLEQRKRPDHSGLFVSGLKLTDANRLKRLRHLRLRSGVFASHHAFGK